VGGYLVYEYIACVSAVLEHSLLDDDVLKQAIQFCIMYGKNLHWVKKI